MLRYYRSCACVVCLAFSNPQFVSRTVLCITGVGTLPGGISSVAYGVNNAGQVAG